MDIRTFQYKVKSKALYKLKLDKRLKHWEDSRYLKLLYALRFGTRLNLDNPQTYSEKLQWLKLNYRDSSKFFLVDKYEVKDWVTERIGSEYVIPTLGIYEAFDEIDFDALPDSFVLKTTHDSGSVVICHDKTSLDIPAAKSKLERSLKRTYFYGGREPHYRNLTPRIIAEPLIVDDVEGQLRDYKFFCFGGEAKVVYVTSERQTGSLKIDYFDRDFQWMDMRQSYPNASVRPSKPERFDEMIEIAETLSQGHPHVRVDLYLVNGHIYFGEMTFFNMGGMAQFFPSKWDKTWGDWLKLPAPVKG